MAAMDRQPLVLIPGLLNDAELWRDQIAALSDVADIAVGDITQGTRIADLAAGIIAQAPAQFALAGFSLGGYVAQEIARQAPDRLTRLALLDTSMRGDNPERVARRRQIDEAVRVPGRFNGFGDRLLSTYLDPSHVGDAGMVARIRGMTERLGPEVLLRQNELERPDGREVLGRLRCPVLILCGENDRVTPVERSREMAAVVPQARLVVIPGSGHLTPIEAADVVNGELRTWLAA